MSRFQSTLGIPHSELIVNHEGGLKDNSVSYVI